MDKNSLLALLREHHTSFGRFIDELDGPQFEQHQPGKWSAGMQLEHINKSIRPVLLAFKLPRIFIRVFGQMRRPSRDYQAVVEKYISKLAAGGKAPSPFVPKTIQFEHKHKLLSQYKALVDSLLVQVEKCSDKDLDHYLLPHPLIGKMSMREMLYFCAYHVKHHEQSLRNALGR